MRKRHDAQPGDSPCACSPPRSRRCPRPADSRTSPGRSPKYLHAAGHDVRLFTPAYASIDRAACAARPVPQLQRLRLSVGPHRYVFSVLRGELARRRRAGVPDRLPGAVSRAPTLYTSDADEHLRFLAFTRAALMACQRMRWAPRSSTATTGTPAFAPLFLRTLYRRRAAVRRHAHGAHHPQHRLPGHLPGGARGGSRPRA